MTKSEPSSTEFERLVEAALKVDPKGLSGKHKNDEGTILEGTEAARIEAILIDSGYSRSQVNRWWYASHPKLGGRTPLQVWRSDLEVTAAILTMVREAATWSASAPH